MGFFFIVFVVYLHSFKRVSWNSFLFMYYFLFFAFLLIIYIGSLMVFGIAIVILVIYIGFLQMISTADFNTP